MPVVINGSNGISGADGSASTPAIQGSDNNTGVFFPAADTAAIATNGAERMRIDSSGNVGIGTTSPGGKLEVSGQADFTTVVGAGYGVRVRSPSGSATPAMLQFTNNPVTAQWYAIQSPSADVLAFNNGGGTEKMRIDASGNLGIGTTSPAAKLDVVGALRLTNTSTAANFGTLSDGGGLVITSGNSNPMYFYVGGSERMRIDSSGNLLFNSGYGSAATAYGCRAWVNFNGTGTVAIRASGNVTSITDNGTGDYTVNFTTSMPDANYAFFGTAGRSASNADSLVNENVSTVPTTSAVRFGTTTGAGTLTDMSYINISIFR
jgi:hypothetical protein